MIKYLLKQKWYIGLILVLIIAEPTINSVLNFWLQGLFNTAEPGANKIVLLRLLTIGFLLWILKRLLSYASGLLKARFICNAKQDVKHKMFISLLGLETSNIAETASSGEYLSLFVNDINLIEQRFFNQIVSLISSVLSIVILGSSFIALNAKLAAAILLFGIVAMFVPVFFSKNLNEKNLKYSNMISKFTQKTKEFFTAYPTIKNYSIENEIIDKFNGINAESEDTKFEAEAALTLANNVGALLSWFMQFIGVGFGLMLVVKGEILVGTVIAAQSFASDLGLPLQNVIISINSIRSTKEIVKKVETIADSQVNRSVNAKFNESQNINAVTLPETIDVFFEDLSLTLGGKTIIDHFSFKFENGKKYLIVGLNGSGKSSLFRALKKWFHNCTGTIRINETNIDSLSNSTLSTVVSYLNENVSLFSGSVKDNVSLFTDYSPVSFQKAIQAAQVRLDLEREINDEGRNISSGEQRRIEIARSLLRSARFLIFDEVVSTLDIETAYEIEKLALDFSDKTVVFISHNFSGKLIREYDEILVMDSGRLVAHGKYEELINTCDYFRRICEIKFG